MVSFLLFCLFCYFLFMLSSLLFPIFLFIGAIILVLYGCKLIFDVFIPRPAFDRRNDAHFFYTSRNPASWLIAALWQGIMRILYQLIFTITKAIHDGRNR